MIRTSQQAISTNTTYRSCPHLPHSAPAHLGAIIAIMVTTRAVGSTGISRRLVTGRKLQGLISVSPLTAEAHQIIGMPNKASLRIATTSSLIRAMSIIWRELQRTCLPRISDWQFSELSDSIKPFLDRQRFDHLPYSGGSCFKLLLSMSQKSAGIVFIRASTPAVLHMLYYARSCARILRGKTFIDLHPGLRYRMTSLDPWIDLECQERRCVIGKDP